MPPPSVRLDPPLFPIRCELWSQLITAMKQPDTEGGDEMIVTPYASMATMDDFESRVSAERDSHEGVC
jgi:hypothetical protein